jgi:hypothetical protein
MRSHSSRRILPTTWLVPLAVGAATAAFRLITFGAIENDHYVILARAYQVLAGDWPIRDFEDPGYPAAYLLSAGAAFVFGPSLAVEVLLDVTIVALAAAMTFQLAHRASGSLTVGLAAAALEVMLYPRLYNAPKLFVPIVAIAIAWRYAAAPGTAGLLALGAWTGVAFLVRHDFVVYVGAAALALILTGGGTPEVWRRRAAWFAVSVLAVVLPWACYVQWAVGLPAYLASAMRFTVAEAYRTESPASLYFWVLVALPVTSLMLSRGRSGRVGAGEIRFAAVLALLMFVVFLRDVLPARLPDVGGPLAVLLAWLAGRVVPPRALIATGLIALAASAAVVGWALAQRGYGLPAPADVARQAGRVAQRLHDDGRSFASAQPAVRAARYLARCTGPSDRVLVSGFGPEIPVVARRAFAGGVPDFLPGYYESPAEVARAIARLERQAPAVAIMLEGSEPFLARWPAVAGWLRARGFEERAAPSLGPGVTVWTREVDPSTPRDPDTALPCPTP